MKSSMGHAFLHRSLHQLNHCGGSREGIMSSFDIRSSPTHEQILCLNWSLSHCTSLYLIEASGIHHITAIARRLHCNWIWKGVLSELQRKLLAFEMLVVWVTYVHCSTPQPLPPNKIRWTNKCLGGDKHDTKLVAVFEKDSSMTLWRTWSWIPILFFMSRDSHQIMSLKYNR